LSSWWWA